MKTNERITAKTKPKAKAAKVDRRPYAHALDTREAFLALHTAIEELGPVVDHAEMLYGSTRRDGTKRKVDVTRVGISPLMIHMWEMQMAAEKVREAAKRALVASYGLAHARGFDGWSRGQWIGSPTYRNPLERWREKQRKARRAA